MTVRGCGSRAMGGTYLECRLVMGGSPPEKFMIDPVRELPEGLDIPHRGVAIIERVIQGVKTGVFDVYDRVGRAGYKHVADFLYEVKKKGASRRISGGTDFSLLTPESCMVFIHDHAIIENADQLYRAIAIEMTEMTGAHHWFCPCGVPGHETYPSAASWTKDLLPTCIGALNEVVAGEETYDPDMEPRSVQRKIGDLTYYARHAPIGFVPEYEPGIFLRLPISHIAVIKDPESHRDEKALERASQSSIPISLEDE